MLYFLLLLLPHSAAATNAPEFMIIMDSAFKICAQAENAKTTLSQQQKGCVFSKICRETVRDAYAPLFKTCEDMSMYFRDLSATMKCPKKVESPCRFDRKLLNRAEDMAKDLEKSMKKNLKSESLDRGCEPYLEGMNKSMYAGCPDKPEISFMRGFQAKLMPEIVQPLVTLLIKLGKNER